MRRKGGREEVLFALTAPAFSCPHTGLHPALPRLPLSLQVRYSPFADGAYYVYDTPGEMEAELAELGLMQQVGGGEWACMCVIAV